MTKETFPRRRSLRGSLIFSLTAVALTSLLSACSAESALAPTSSSTATATVTPSGPTPTASPSPSAPAEATEDIALPGSCEELYSDSMRATLGTRALNHPGITAYSTQDVALRELIDSGIPTLKCTWGQPSESAAMTNVTIVDGDQTASVLDILVSSGFDCSQTMGGTLCSLFTPDPVFPGSLETHFLRGNGWVSSQLANFPVDGYTEDVAATLWG